MESEVKKTKKYDQFKTILANREVDNRHLRKLIDAIKKKNMLHLNPILVNSEMQIVDGQHRLEAARSMDLPIYYMVDDTIGKKEISDLNVNKKGWTTMDYINFWSVEKAKGFDVLSSFMSRYKHYGVSTMLALLSADGKYKVGRLKEGDLDITNKDKAEEVLQVLEEYGNYCDFYADRSFVLAIRTAIDSGNYDHEIMKEKLEYQSRSLVRCINTKQYLEMLEEIYNYRSRNPVKFS